MKRVVLTGPESTGKTELARALARRFDAELASEFVRDYAMPRGNRLSYDDHEPIARGQLASEDAAIARARGRGAGLVVQDTDLISTVLYHDHYYGRWPVWMEDAARERRADLYLLMNVDVPWIADEVRDRGDRRAELLALFERWLDRMDVRWMTITGDWAEREASAARAIDELLREAR